MPGKDDYAAMHHDAVESLDAIESIQEGLSQLTGNIKRLVNFSGKLMSMDEKKMEKVEKTMMEAMEDGDTKEMEDKDTSDKGLRLKIALKKVKP